MTTKLRIGNIPRTSTANDLETVFGRFGIVDSIEIITDPQSGLSTGCGVVAMCNDGDAQTAIDRLNFTQYTGRTISVSRARNV